MTRTPLKFRILPTYTKGEEVFNMTSHIVGGGLGVVILALCTVFSALHADPWAIVGSAIYGVSLILLYTASSIYHGLRPGIAKKVFQVIDHCTIYFLIAGTYTPFCLVALRPGSPALAWTIFGLEWGGTLAGIFFKIWTTGRFRIVSTLAYIVMGWVAILAIVPLIRSLHGLGTMWLTLGGGLYTLGCVFYLWKSLPYAHMVWHLFVLAGTISHFFCILWYVM